MYLEMKWFMTPPAMAMHGMMEEEPEYSSAYLMRKMASINRNEWKRYVLGFCFAVCESFFAVSMKLCGLLMLAWIGTGAVYPCFGIVWANAVNGFSLTDPAARRHTGDRNALWYVYFS